MTCLQTTPAVEQDRTTPDSISAVLAEPCGYQTTAVGEVLAVALKPMTLVSTAAATSTSYTATKIANDRNIFNIR